MPESRPVLLDSGLLSGDAYLVTLNTLVPSSSKVSCFYGESRMQSALEGEPKNLLSSVHLCALRGQGFEFVKLECLVTHHEDH